MGVSRNSGWVLVLLSVVVVGLSAVALAGGHRSAQEIQTEPVKPAEAHGEMRHMHFMAERLELTDAQQKDFAALLELYRPRFDEIVKRGDADRQALFDMAPDDPGYSALSELVSQDASRAAAESVTLLTELQGLVYDLLSPEQRVVFMELRAEQRERIEERRARYRAGDFRRHPRNKHRQCQAQKGEQSCTHGKHTSPLKESA